MDKKITELKETEGLTGFEYIVVASQEDAENYKVKVSDFAEDAIDVDDALSETSENPVQNKVITSHINNLEDRLETVEDTTGRLLDLNVAQVDTYTLNANEKAKVEILDLGTDETDTKSLAFKFYIPRGAIGQQGEQGITGTGGRTVFAFKHSEEKPETPTGGSWNPVTNEITYPVGWSPTDNLESPIWMSNATFDEFKLVIDWSEPIQITGPDGMPGADGIKLEFIYKQVKDETVVVERPYSNPTITDYVPRDEGWEDHPQGVSEEMQCEYVCTRSRNEETGFWNKWEGPALWAKYGANGKDGDGVEYIYQVTLEESAPKRPGRVAASHSPVTDYQEREFIPESAASEYNWTDNPQGVSQVFLCEWVSVRKYKWDTQEWGDWSYPTLWAKYGKDGKPGSNGAVSLLSIVFCRTNSVPRKPDSTDGSYSQPVPEREVEDVLGNKLGVYWHDSIPQGEEMVWSSQRIFSYDGEDPQQPQWSDPTQMTDTSSYDVEFSPNEICPNTPAENKEDRLAQGWYDITLNPDFDFSTAIWRAERWKQNGIWTPWVIYKIKGEKGDNGTSITIVGSYDSYDELEAAWQAGTLKGNNPPEIGDTYLINGECWIWDGDSWFNGGGIKGEPGRNIQAIITQWAAGSSNTSAPTTGWDSNSPATTNEKPYIWKQWYYIYDDSTNSQIYYECVGKQGDKGVDGPGQEYIYYLTAYKTTPKEPSAPNPINSNPGAEAWNDDPQELSVQYKYLYISEHTKVNGVWGPYSPAVLWDELGGPYIHIKYANSTTKDDWTTNNGEDAGPYIGSCVNYDEGDHMVWDDYRWVKWEGEDGFNREYIFALTNDFDNPPIVPEDNDEDEDQYIPTDDITWYADPLSPTENNKYCWGCHRDKEKGKWGPWRGNASNPTRAYLFSMFAQATPGKTGSQGPILYPAGEWHAGALPYKQTTKVVGNDTITTATPYVLYGKDYYVLQVNSSSNRPDASSDWLKMEKFDAIYTDILLADRATVGNACFYGNYMFSQQGEGTLANFDITTSNPYDSSSGFKPAWCVNLVTGEMWTGTGKCYFAADGSGYLANKKISWGADGTLKLPPTGNINCLVYEYGFGINYANIDFSAASGGGNYEANVILTGYQTTVATNGDILFENNVMLPYGSSVSVGVGATLYKKYDLKVNGEVVATLEKDVTNPDVKDFDWASNTPSFTIELVDVVADRHQINGNYL